MHTTQAMKQMMKYSELLEERNKFENEVPVSILKKMENLLNETVMIQTGQIADLTRIESYFSIVAPEIETKMELLIKEVKDNHILESNLK